MSRTTLELWKHEGLPRSMFEYPDRIRDDVRLLIAAIVEYVEKKGDQ